MQKDQTTHGRDEHKEEVEESGELSCTEYELEFRGYEKLLGCEDGAIGEAQSKDDLIFNLQLDDDNIEGHDDIDLEHQMIND